MANKKRWGDRRDAVRIRDIDGFHAFLAYLMPNRADAEVYLHYDVDVTQMTEYIARQNKEREKHMTIFHCVNYAFTRVIYNRPLLNRYISGKRYYEKDHVSLAFVAKKQFTDHAQEALMVLRPKDTDTLSDFTDRIVGDVHVAREEVSEYGVDGTLNLLGKMPRFVMSIVMFVFRFLDRHGKMPKSITDNDPNNATVLLSNLGSIHCDAAYHHLNNYGTNSIMVTIGEMHKEKQTDASGEESLHTFLPMGITIDERIADGFYFAKSVKMLDRLFSNPEMMEQPVREELKYEY